MKCESSPTNSAPSSFERFVALHTALEFSRASCGTRLDDTSSRRRVGSTDHVLGSLGDTSALDRRYLSSARALAYLAVRPLRRTCGSCHCFGHPSARQASMTACS